MLGSRGERRRLRYPHRNKRWLRGDGKEYGDAIPRDSYLEDDGGDCEGDAIAGSSGAGKSSLAALLAHHVEPATGIIRMGGIDLGEVSAQSLTATLGTVPQDAYLFAATVRENLALALEEDPSEAELWRVLEAAKASDIVHRLPSGLDTPIGLPSPGHCCATRAASSSTRRSANSM